MGPAGHLLDEALAAAGIARAEVYLTNAVKHFKYRLRGKRRIHQRPSVGELNACRQWLSQEIEALTPELLVAMGASAAHALIGRATPIRANRGQLLQSAIFSAPVLVTAHPSSVLREREASERERAMAALVADLRVAAGAS